MSHTAELIAVGTELLLGNIANTDAQMLSQGLSQPFTPAVRVQAAYLPLQAVPQSLPDRLRHAKGIDIGRIIHLYVLAVYVPAVLIFHNNLHSCV